MGEPVIAVKVTIVIITAIVIQATVLSHLTVFGAMGDLLLLLAIAAGFEGGAERGAIVGFASGLMLDLLLSTPAGMSALTFTLVGYVVGMFQSSVLRSSRLLSILTAVGASAAGVLLYWILGSVLGQTSGLHATLPAIVIVVAFINGAMSPLILTVTRWAFREDDSDRIALR